MFSRCCWSARVGVDSRQAAATMDDICYKLYETIYDNNCEPGECVCVCVRVCVCELGAINPLLVAACGGCYALCCANRMKFPRCAAATATAVAGKRNCAVKHWDYIVCQCVRCEMNVCVCVCVNGGEGGATTTTTQTQVKIARVRGSG